ncbi:hypothetical protein [Cryobacterium shii]|uniref:Bacterial Ig-like domain-containing protein n=1 Tax=Cryobacterium shii TaxID=1259235 RepID=A0AAQ2C7G6_9MICO|nr:hypothetical protein [Cryobacterium shii]TFC51183.1 hypothetical protein E3O49_03610 [Cryobacterium shii]
MVGTRFTGSGSSRARRSYRAGRLLAGVLLLGFLVPALLAGGSVGSAVAATSSPTPAPAPTPAATPAATPAPTRSSAPPTVSPTITGPRPGSFVGSGSTTVSGTGEPGQEIQLLSAFPGEDPSCILVVDDSSEWSCTGVRLPSGPSVRLRVVVTADPAFAAEQTIAVLAAPVVTGGPSGQAASNGVVRGTAYPNASVIVRLADGNRCTATADTSGAWTCAFGGRLASGAAEVTAAQQATFSLPSWSNESAAIALLFDVDRPAPPTVTEPAAGGRVPLDRATYAGSGENGSTVTVFAGAYSVCSGVVAGGSWTCSAGGVAAGSYAVIAVQQDAAGNVGQGSPAFTLAYGPAAPAPAAGRATPSPRASAPLAAATATAAPAPEPARSPQTATPSQRDGDEAVALGALPGGWSDPTRFATAVLPPWSPSGLSWSQAVLLSLGSLMLLYVPARLLAGTLSRSRGGRPVWPGTAIAGRNRARQEYETAPDVAVNRWLVAGAALAAAATLIMLSGPVTSQPAYLRLLLAVMVALIVVNGVGALVPLWWSSRICRVPASVTFLPRYLLLVAVTALGSRLFEVHPALVFGLLGSVAATPGALNPERGQIAAVRAGSLIGLSTAGWLALGLLPTADGFLSSLGAEIANSVVLTAIGSVALVLIPIGRTSGRSILAWSPSIWAGLTTLAFTIMFGVLSPAVAIWNGDGTVTLLGVAAGVFAALSVGAWAWQRFVTPSRG